MDPTLAPHAGNIVIGRGRRLSVYYVPLRARGWWPQQGQRGHMLDLFALERRALTRAMQYAAPDLVHAHWQYEYAWAALDSGLPHLVTCHDAPWRILAMHRDAYRFGRLLMARHVMQRATLLTAVSPYLRDALSPMTQAPITVVPNPLPRGDRSAKSARGDRPARVMMILNGWSRHKNPELGLEALRRLHDLHPGTELHVAGPDFGAGERGPCWAEQAGCASLFQFHGRLPYRDVQRLLSTMDLLLHPSLEESFGMTVAEAMSYGIPVVAGHQTGAVPWVTGNGAAGRLVDVRSAAAMTSAMSELLNDDAAYTRCSQAGRERADRMFSAAAVVDAYAPLYERVTAGVVAR